MDEKEYIEREALIKELCTVSAPTPSESWIVEKCIDKVNSAPSADVVEVVRCKDCEHWGGVTLGNICRKWSGLDLKNCTTPTGFCSYGKRKE